MPIPNTDVLVDAFLEAAPMRALISIPPEAVEQAMGAAYRCFCAGAHADAEILCKGLIAADHRHWYPRTLYAATLVRLGRPREALAQIAEGLRHHPGQPRLVALRKELLATALRWGLEAAGGAGGERSTPPPPPPPPAASLSRPEAA